MAENNTYKMVELVGTSGKSFADAASQGVKRASKTLRNLDWFEVIEMRGRIQSGKVAQYQVKIKVGFRLED
ncbi:MAG: hypothetical protein DMF59_03345 [Acidobacteria bacterium]|nr:MAG: hypothetical protein DMF59_03345 [Acidobacteriota bacterium]